MENDIVLSAADDSSSYVTSQPPSVTGLESLENSMDGFPDTSREDESLMDTDDLTGDGELFQHTQISASLSTEPGAFGLLASHIP